MIDIHCHILPRIDDGAASLEESLDMVRLAMDSGVTGIVATPHFRGDPASLALLEPIQRRLKELARAMEQENLPLDIWPGGEVLCMPQTVEMAKLGQLPTLGNSNYLLCEFVFDEPFAQMDQLLEDIAQAGYIPVVAHPERYGDIQLDPRLLIRWFRRGYLIQVNKGSILGALGRRSQQAARWILDAGLAHLVASDAHSSLRRTTDVRQLRYWLEEHLPGAYVDILTEENPARLVRGEAMVPIE